MKQGKASMSGLYDRKVEPSSQAINPHGVSQIGVKQGNHLTDGGVGHNIISPIDAGRGYSSPSIGSKSHKSGSQGSY